MAPFTIITTDMYWVALTLTILDFFNSGFTMGPKQMFYGLVQLRMSILILSPDDDTLSAEANLQHKSKSRLKGYVMTNYQGSVCMCALV